MSRKLFGITCVVLLLISSVIMGFSYVQAVKTEQSQPANLGLRRNTTPPVNTLENGDTVKDTNNCCPVR